MTERKLTFEPRANASRVALLVLAIAVVAGVFAFGSQGVLGDTHNVTAVTVDAPVTDLETGDSANVTVGIDGATDGVSAYKMTLATNDSDVATLEDVAVHADGEDGPLVHTDRSVDGAELTVTVALLDAEHDAANSTDLFDVELAAHGGGDVTLEVADVSEVAAADTDAYEYEVDRTETVDVSVTESERPVPDVSISAPPAVQTGTAANATVGLEGATEGVSAYEMTVVTNDSDVATLEDVTVHADGENGPLINTVRSTNGSKLTVTVALLDAVHGPADSIDLFDVELEGRSEGPVGLEIAEVDEITDIDLETYTVGQRDGAELAVTDEPGFLVTIDDETDDRVVAGDGATVVAEVENTGETEATGELELATETEAIDTSPVTLAGGETTNVTMVWETTADDVGEHDLLVEIDNVTATTAIEVIETPESAFFDPAITNASTPVEGEVLRVETAVTNTGDLTDTQTVSLEIGGETVDTVENVSLEGRESTAVTLGWDTTVGDNGTYDATVTTANESDTESVAVAEAVAGPSFDVAISEVNDSVPAGEDLFVDVTVANVGKESGSAAIDLDVDGDSIDSQTVDLEADDETTLTFVYPTDDEDPSALDVTVTSPDDTDTTTARVTSPEPAFFEVELVDPPAEVAAADNVTIQSTVVNVGSVAATQDLELVVDETVVDASTVSLNGSETETVNMTWEAPENETGERNVSVTSRNETATTTLEVGADGESDDGAGGGGGGIVLPEPGDDESTETGDDETDDETESTDETDDETESTETDAGTDDESTESGEDESTESGEDESTDSEDDDDDPAGGPDEDSSGSGSDDASSTPGFGMSAAIVAILASATIWLRFSRGTDRRSE